MQTKIDALMKALKKGDFPPVCIADGEEPYYIEKITELYEVALPEAQRDFNLTVFYGKDAPWADVMNACRRFPMFADRQVVILKDAAKMDDLDKLTSYLENPTPTTIFYVEHRFKALDKRTKFYKAADKSQHVQYANSAKLKDGAVVDWIMRWGGEIGFAIGQEEAQILTVALGNDLQKIANEVEKVRINVPGESRLTLEMIRKYIGAGREYNIFEFPGTFTNGDADTRYRMLSHFGANPKVAPMVLMLSTFYTHFRPMYASCFVPEGGKEVAALIGVPPFKIRDTYAAARRIGVGRLEDIMLLIADTSAQAVGIGALIKEKELLREFCGRLERILGL